MRAHVDRRHLGYGDLFPPDNRGTIDNSVGQGNGRFLGHVANGMARAELVRRWKAGEFPDLNAEIARQALSQPVLSMKGEGE